MVHCVSEGMGSCMENITSRNDPEARRSLLHDLCNVLTTHPSLASRPIPPLSVQNMLTAS